MDGGGRGEAALGPDDVCLQRPGRQATPCDPGGGPCHAGMGGRKACVMQMGTVCHRGDERMQGGAM